MTSLRARFVRDDGFTLPELLVYAVVMTIVLTIVAGLIITTTMTEKTVRNVFTAATDGQVAADNVQTGIRNSSAYKLTSPTSTTQLVTARVAHGGASVVWVCAAWYYTPANGGSIRYHESPAAIPNPTAAQAADWTSLIDGITPSSGTKIFSTTGDQLTIAYEVNAGDDPPASIVTSAARRVDIGESLPCF